MSESESSRGRFDPLFVQLSGFQTVWLRWRWLLLATGGVFAAIITRFVVLGFFSADPVR